MTPSAQLAPFPKPSSAAAAAATATSPSPTLTNPSSTNPPAVELAFAARRSRVLLVAGLPPAQANQLSLRTWLASRLGGGTPADSLGILGVCAHAPATAARSDLQHQQHQQASDGPSTASAPSSWWIIFQEHHIARDIHRQLLAAEPEPKHQQRVTGADGISLELALEEDLAPLDGLVPMPLLPAAPRFDPQQQQEHFPTQPSTTDDAFGPPLPSNHTHAAAHARTPSLSFSSTSSAPSTHPHASPASQHTPDLGPPPRAPATTTAAASASATVRPRASALSLGSRFDVGAKPFFPADHHVWASSAHAGDDGGGDEGAQAQAQDDERRPEMGGRSQSLGGLYGLGFSPGGGDGFGGPYGSMYDGVDDLGLSSLGLTGTGGGAAVSFRQGDWICPSDTCSYHNFSRNEQCLICATAKPPSSSSRAAAPRPELTTPTPQRLPPSTAAFSPGGQPFASTATPQPAVGNGPVNDGSPGGGGGSHLTAYQHQAIQSLAAARNVAFPPHLTRSSPATFHALPTRPLLNSVSLPDFQGGAVAAAERARRISTLSSPGVQMSPLPPSHPSSGQGSPQQPTVGPNAWRDPTMLTTTPSPMGRNGAGTTSYFSPGVGSRGTSGASSGWSTTPPASLGLEGVVRGRSLTFAGGSGATDGLPGPGPGGNGSGSGNGHRSTVSLGGGSGSGNGNGAAHGNGAERFAPIVNSGNTGPMTIQQGDWACGTCGFVNWRRRRVCLKCFPFAEGNELAGGNLAASVMLVTQLAQAPANNLPAIPPPPPPSSSSVSAGGNPYQTSPYRGTTTAAPPPTGANRSFISSGPFRPPPQPSSSSAADAAQSQQVRGGEYDVFGLVSPVHSPPGQQVASFVPASHGPNTGGAGVGAHREPVAPLSPIGAEVRSLAHVASPPPPLPSARPTFASRPSSSSAREVGHQRQASVDGAKNGRSGGGSGGAPRRQ